MKLYGIASRPSRDVDEWHASREEAERVLAEILADEPGLIDLLFVEEVELETGQNGVARHHRDLPEALLERYLSGARWGRDAGNHRRT